MRLVLVNYEEYDMYNVRVAYPVEFESKEALIAEFELQKDKGIAETKRKNPTKEWMHRHALIELCGIPINIDSSRPDEYPEFYTVDEWFEQCKYEYKKEK